MSTCDRQSSNMSLAGSLARRAGLASLAVAAIASQAHAVVVNWANAVSGSTGDSARWSPAIVPAAADDWVFNASAGVQNYTVTVAATTPTSRSLTFNQDNVTLSIASPHTTTAGFTIADGVTDIATVTLASGTWTSALSSSTAFDIGDAPGAVGTLNVTDDSADLILTGAGSRIRIGNNGTGTLSITGGGRVEVGAVLLASATAASSGTLIVSGAQAISPFQRSTLVCTNAADVSSLGGGNNGITNISNGALMTTAGDVEVGRSSTSTSTVTIGGAGGIGGIHDATLSVAGDSFIGGNGSTTLAGGIGTVTVNNNGLFLTGGTLHVGNDPNGGTGTLTINSGALVSATSVIDGAGGTINHSAGTLRIDGGTYTGHPVPLVVSGTGSPTLQYSSNSVNTLTAVGGVGLRVGDDLGAGTFTGNLIIDSGADVIMSGLNNDINIGDDAGTSGVVTVTGAGSRLVADQPGDLIRVGFNGTGDLRVESAGQVLATEIQVPASSLNGNGEIFMAGIGSSITTANLAVGNAAGLGSGSITMNPQCTLTATNPSIGVVIRDTGIATVTANGNLNATGTILIDGGTLTVGGTVNAGTVAEVDTGGLLRSNISNAGTPLVDARVRIRSGGVVEAIFENLTMGDDISTSGVLVESGGNAIIASSRTLTLRKSGVITWDGRLTLQGGTIDETNNSFINMNGTAADQLSGNGTIATNINLNDLGVCAPAGSGINFQNLVDIANSLDIAGTSITFESGSELRDFGGGHLFNCKVTADAGSVMRPGTGNSGAFGAITMGNGTANCVSLDGVLHMGTNGSLTFNDSVGVDLGTLTDMNGGVIACASGIAVFGGTLQGRGTIDVANVAADGLIIGGAGFISPDAYFSTTDEYRDVATFTVDGMYSQQLGSTFVCEIAGVNNEFQPLNDRINAGPAALSATLDVRLINGYEPRLCDEFTILTYTSRTGTWTTIIEPPGVDVGIRYEPTRAVLFFNTVECNDIDFNNDGALFDPQDIDAYLSVYSEGPCIPAEATCDDLDFNNDCSIFDPADIDSFLSVFSEGPCTV
jgi:fibronectin-binding autotransporter adhesin